MLPSPLARWFSRTIGFPLVINGGWRPDKDRRHFARLLRHKLDSQYWPPEQMAPWQLERLRRLLEHAGQNVPYYRDLFHQIGFDPRGLTTLADLGALPTLTRRTLQEQGPRLLAENLPSSSINIGRTGGSSGAPLEFWRDRAFDLDFEASAWLADLVAGRRYGSRTGYLWGASRDINPYLGLRGFARARLRNEFIIDARALSDSDLARHHRVLQRRPPEVLVSYASAADHLARYFEQHGLTPNYPLAALIPTGEPLEPAMRARLERVFPAPVFDRYGSREVGLMAYECQQHAGLHLNLTGMHLECLGPDVYSTPGEVVITQLHNYAMPLIRYEIGDLALLAAGPCPCGRAAPRLRQVAGRKMQPFINAAGHYVESYSLVAEARKSPHLREFQLIQEDPRHLRLLIIPEPSCTPEHLAVIRAEILEFMGPECELVIEPVSHIPLPASGKRQMLVSKIKSS
ncbi:MAG: hypothetical protein ABI847_20120 [Anaerolineales bacterium]